MNRTNSSAEKSMDRQKRKNLVYMSGNIREGICLDIWQGLLKRIKKTDDNLICYAGGELGEDRSSLVYNLINFDRMDGFIGHASSEGDAYRHYYSKFANRPFIALSQPISGFPAVVNDSCHSVRELIDHLVKEHSFTKIAFVRGPENQLYTEQRFQAYLDAVREYNLYNPDLVSPPLSFDTRSGRDAIRFFLDKRGLKPGIDIDALVFVSDMLAVSAVRELKKRMIRIPEQLAVTGINGVREALCADPPLTTIGLPFSEQGASAVDLLLQKIDGKSIPQLTVLPGKFITGYSCGCRPEELVLNSFSGGSFLTAEREFTRRIRLEQTLRSISEKFLTSYRIETLLEILARGLSDLEIPSCFISLFEDSGEISSLFDPPENAKMVFAFEKGVRVEVNPQAGLFPSCDLLPETYLQDEVQKILIVHSLHFESKQIGFMVFELGPEEGFVYFALSKLISSALADKYKDYVVLLNQNPEQNRDSVVSDSLSAAPSEDNGNIFISIYSERFQLCKEFIDRHYLTINTMDDIERSINLQKNYICRLFRMFNHESPYQYLLGKKMNHAYKLLSRTNTLVRVVAAETGFADPYHFSKLFKKTFKISPRDVRHIESDKFRV